ncbi:MAG TPA: sn-glycerol-3-phosphate ABC transporter ATP-binding protein UgpC [Thermoanaerobaculia bacterium]|nr:sn-glycerol-3-phosphate ABC transporter ATP-binding protein UgpC [Thermoanaerobaculia bacterium]
MAGVTFDNVAKRFNGVSVIEGLDLDIEDHEFMVLVGPSGCGKSTALRMIAGLEEISGGRVLIGNRVVNDLQPKDRDVAMVFQNYALYPHMSVRENIEFGLKIRKTPREEMRRKVDEAAQTLGIATLLERKPKQLSGGQRQRVAVARAIVRDPKVFLFDEPLSNLDAKLRVQMRAEITRLQQRLGTTCVYVTHDQIEAMTMGHRISVMKEGRIQQVGTPLEVYDRPANVFVAQFIGTPPMNFFDATVNGDRLEAASFSLPLPYALPHGQKLRAGIRPEHLTRGNAPVQTVVELVEPIGHEAVVHTRAGNDLLVATYDVHRMPRTGDTIELQLQTEKLHLFDAATELRVG